MVSVSDLDYDGGQYEAESFGFGYVGLGLV